MEWCEHMDGEKFDGRYLKIASEDGFQFCPYCGTTRPKKDPIYSWSGDGEVIEFKSAEDCQKMMRLIKEWGKNEPKKQTLAEMMSEQSIMVYVGENWSPHYATLANLAIDAFEKIVDEARPLPHSPETDAVWEYCKEKLKELRG